MGGKKKRNDKKKKEMEVLCPDCEWQNLCKNERVGRRKITGGVAWQCATFNALRSHSYTFGIKWRYCKEHGDRDAEPVSGSGLRGQGEFFM